MLKENNASEVQGTTEAISEASVLLQCKDSENSVHARKGRKFF